MPYEESANSERRDILVAKSAPSKEQTERARVEAFLRLAKERFKLAAEAEQETRDKALDDMKFSVGEQWPDDIRTQRTLDGRPCLTMNRIPQFKRQVTNEQRQQKPAIQINPVGDGADVDTAEIFQGIVRHIENNSDSPADVAYDTGFDQMVTGGFGYWKICKDYIGDNSFDQELMIKRVKNQFTIYFDPTAVEPDYCDADWAFEVEDMPKSEYKGKFPNSEVASLVDFTSIGDLAPGWATKETIRVADYWHIEQEQKEIALLSDGRIVESTEIPEGAEVLKRRKVLDRKVICSRINALEILNPTEENWQGIEWEGNWIPIIPVLGDDQEVNGKRYLAGLVRHAKDPARMYNYWVTSATEAIALAPKAPFIGAEGQFENHEGQWSQANQRNFAYLEYKPVDVQGRPAPPPERNSAEPPIQAMAVMIKQADNDLKAVVGLFDPSLGEKSDQSGKAISLLQRQGGIANLNYIDNLSRAIRCTGKQLIDLIPKIYDAPRVQRIINPDGSVDHVGVFNSKTSGIQDAAANFEGKGIMRIYDIGVGRYDVTVSTGPSYQTKRQEAVASQLALVGSFPQAVPIIGDLIVKNMDWPGADEMAKRLKKMLPPQLQDEPDGQDAEQQVQQLQTQLQQLTQQHELMVQELNKNAEIIKTDQLKYQSQAQIAAMETASKERIAAYQTQAALIQTEAKIQAENAQAMLTAEIKRLETITGQIHERIMQKESLNAAVAAPATESANSEQGASD